MAWIGKYTLVEIFDVFTHPFPAVRLGQGWIIQPPMKRVCLYLMLYSVFDIICCSHAMSILLYNWLRYVTYWTNIRTKSMPYQLVIERQSTMKRTCWYHAEIWQYGKYSHALYYLKENKGGHPSIRKIHHTWDEASYCSGEDNVT